MIRLGEKLSWGYPSYALFADAPRVPDSRFYAVCPIHGSRWEILYSRLNRVLMRSSRDAWATALYHVLLNHN